MDFSFSNTFDKNFLRQTMMGPNAMRVTEELTSFLSIPEGARILDLGCGMGLSSILLAKKHKALVFALDLWIDSTDNARRFAEQGLDNAIIPLSLDVTQCQRFSTRLENPDGTMTEQEDEAALPEIVVEQALPFARDYFDFIVSVDSYQYFGHDETMLPKLLPFLKPGGAIAAAMPGLHRDFPRGGWPASLMPWLEPVLDSCYFYSPAWWKALWEKEPGIRLENCREMDCFRQAWDDWLSEENPYAQHDIGMMNNGGYEHFNIVQMIARKK